MNSRVIVILGLIGVVVASVAPRGYVNAAVPVLNLPQTPVMAEALNGTKSHFQIFLSGVPSGYDVADGKYPGWCVDIRYLMQDGPFVATLYSSLNSPPMVGTQKWDMVNYILNHKQGKAIDVQEAIWYFVNLKEGYAPSRALALAMVDDAKANGTGFVPKVGQVLAVIVYPLPTTQISVIEVLIQSPLRSDINNDGAVDIADAVMLANAFNSRRGDPNWNSRADLKSDGVVDIFDAVILSNDFGQTVT